MPATPAQILSAVAPAVERLVDRLGTLLSGLPASPFTNLLAAGLWEVRRTLFPIGPGVGLWGTAACVTSGDCSGQDLTGVDLSGKDLNDSVNFAGANLTRAVLTGANFAGANLSGATLTDASLAKADFSGADLSGADLRDAVFLDLEQFAGDRKKYDTETLFGMYRVNFTDADLAGAELGPNEPFNRWTRARRAVYADFTNADLSYASFANAVLLHAVFTGADVTGADFAGVESHYVIGLPPAGGFGSSTELATQPPTEWLQQQADRTEDWPHYGQSWYAYQPMLRATSGAPITNFETLMMSDDAYTWDGVQGMVKNYSGRAIVVVTRPGSFSRGGACPGCAQAVLLPGDVLPFQLVDKDADYDDGDEDPTAGKSEHPLQNSPTLEFYRYENGQAVGDPAQLRLVDPELGRPWTQFTPPGYSRETVCWWTCRGQRRGWKEGESHREVWGDVNLWVKREDDGWNVSASDTYRQYYGNPSNFSTSDWAIFSIHVDGL